MNMLRRRLDVPALAGLWTRTLLRTADGEDTSTNVCWLQGPSLFADLRQPQGRPDFAHVRALADLRRKDCLWLARQQGFAGVFALQDGVFWWHREIDLQPRGAVPDAGTLAWDGEILVETGHFAAYLEHWRRVPEMPVMPSGALRLRHKNDSKTAILVRTGNIFMFARSRAPGVEIGAASLEEAVAAAPDLAAAQRLVDCEISRGEAHDWKIMSSSLPFREGVRLDLAGWEIVYREGECGL